MLPRHLRVTRSSDFTRALRHGARVRRADIVVHTLRVAEPAIDSGGARFGLIVSKSVGDAVTRHSVARRLRAAIAQAPRSDSEAIVVVRALPGSVDRSSAALSDQLVGALRSGLSR